MEPAFWNTSSLVPLCVTQHSTPTVQAIVSKYQVVVWWATPIEIRGALARLVRTGRLTLNQQVGAQVRLDTLRRNWREVFPSDKVREKAESLVDRFQLTGADALQWAPRGHGATATRTTARLFRATGTCSMPPGSLALRRLRV